MIQRRSSKMCKWNLPILRLACWSSSRKAALARALARYSITLFFIFHSAFFVSTPALAQTPPAEEPKGIQNAPGLISIFGRESGFEGAPREPEVIIGEILQGAMLLIGVLFGILIIYGGYLWMTARGNEETVKKAIGILQTAIIGFIVVASAYAISDFVIERVIMSTYTQGT